MAATTLAAMVMPWRLKRVYEASPLTQHRVGSVPVVTIVAGLFASFLILNLVWWLKDSVHGVNNTKPLIYMGILYAMAAVIWVAAWTVQGATGWPWSSSIAGRCVIRSICADRLAAGDETLALADLLLLKLQVVESNRKDLLDAVALLADHRFTNDDVSGVNHAYLFDLTAKDSGLWRTTVMIAERVAEFATELDKLDAEAKVHARVAEYRTALDAL